MGSYIKQNIGSVSRKKTIQKAPFKITGIKTDNDSIFTNRYTGYAKSTDPLNPKIHIFDNCQRHGVYHYLIDPGKPQQNGKVERKAIGQTEKDSGAG